MLSLLVAMSAIPIITLVQSQSMAQITDPVGVVQCLPFTFTWTPGTPPYDLSVFDVHGTELFKAGNLNDTKVTWTPVTGVGATADSPVEFTVNIQDHGPFSESHSNAENITAGSTAVDSSGVIPSRCANAPVSSSSSTSAIFVTAPISNSASTTFTPTTINGPSKSDSGAVGNPTVSPAAPSQSSNGAVSMEHETLLLLSIVSSVISLLALR
ncbi:hypothetical protein MVEN_01340500 [Mycena venus]|uniref:Uncharacterized protein n=1 Tax=Mycena venus TaxID=2733690 RepID=A0A8H6XXZ3_9AGAR|nr:hypothetical protein MVEN_01340500 [Mycena venus]